MQHELRYFCTLWPGLRDILPQLAFCMEAFYVDGGKRYYGLLKTTRDINCWGMSSTGRTSMIWKQFVMCLRDVHTFIENYIQPMCHYLNTEQSAMFMRQFENYFLTCIEMRASRCCPLCSHSTCQPSAAVDAKPTITTLPLVKLAWRSPAPTYPKHIDELFADDPLEEYNKNYLARVDLCDKQTVRALFVPDFEPETNKLSEPSPSLSLCDYTFPHDTSSSCFDLTQDDHTDELSPYVY